MAANYTQAWLEAPTSIRGLLVEVTAAIYNSSTQAWVETVIYLSNIGYVTGDSSTSYLPYLTGSLQTTESLSLDGSLSMSFGDIEIANTNGDLDNWLDSSQYIWVNRPIQVYLGDPSWPIATLAAVHDTPNGGFQKVFDGIVADIDSKDRSTLNIKVRDKLEKLNGPLSDNKLGTYGTWGQGQTNQDTMRPLVFGEVFNMSPLLVGGTATPEYMFHDTSVGAVITKTASNGNILSCASTSGFVQNAPIIFTGVSITPAIYVNTVYFIKSISSNGTDFTISATSGSITAVTLTDATSVTTSIMQGEVRVSSTEAVLEIRDQGVPIYTDTSIFINPNIQRPVGANISLDEGKFSLTQGNAVTVTASIQGAKRTVDFDSTTNTGFLVEGTYTNNIAKIIAVIVTQYGTPTTRLTSDDIDLTNFKAFSIANTQPVGIAIMDRINTLEVCQQIAMSANARLFMNRIGKLQLIQLGVTTTDPKVYITDNDILHHSLQLSQKTSVVAATKVGYCKNYTPQTTFGGTLPSTHVTQFKDDWLSNTVVDTAIQKTYKLDVLPVQLDTCLIQNADATALATYLNNYWKVPRIVYSFTGTSKLLSLKLGQAVNITHNRFGLTSGKDGQVVSISPNWMIGTVNVEVII